LTEREFEVNRSTVLSGTVVIIDDDELGNLTSDELHEIVISTAIEEDNWQSYDDYDDDITYEVTEN
jgi:hypothetical protein